MNYKKYKPQYDWKKPSKRNWPDRVITSAPKWCSVDLRDGNQALESPMSIEDKIEFFDMLIAMNFKDIEVGFPAASETEYNFIRYLIENDKIPDGVRIQVLTQARPHIIKKTFESVSGAKDVIIHIYNSTSEAQREQVFKKSKEEIKNIAISGARMVAEEASKYKNTNWTFEYSPESFTGTEMDFAVDVINSVISVWHGKTDSKIIINLPATVECSRPNIYADQIEYVQEHMKYRDEIELSIHPHNDRGTGVSTAEMGILAGADRVEGSLFGNGERTGNVDLVIVAMNMFIEGIDPELDFSNIDAIKKVYEKTTNMKVEPRRPYAGDLVFTAFSGSHQDAIAKSEEYSKKHNIPYWNRPYLPIDPRDVGREYKPVRINSQSGRGGIFYVIGKKCGVDIPKDAQEKFMQIVKNTSIEYDRELTDNEIYTLFEEYMLKRKRENNVNLDGDSIACI